MPQPRSTPPPDPDPTPAADQPIGEPSEPEWARQLRETLEQLPGKLRASITDDDRKSIAENVHSLFERSGAFLREEPEGEQEADAELEGKDAPEPVPAAEPAPHKPTLAERMGFPRY